MLQFQEERVADCWDELSPLAYDHHQSSHNYKRHEPFNPLRERYEAYNRSLYHLLTAREDGVLVGYFGVYFTQSMHSQLPIAQEDTFYLAPLHRKGRNALRFLQYVEQFIADAHPNGVEIMFSCEIDNKTGIQGLLKHLDYAPVIRVHSKFIPSRADSAQPTESEAVHGSST